MPSDARLRGAIIGCGYFSRFHAEAWRRISEVDIVAACDPQLERARALASSAFDHAAQMFSSIELDFVDIATRPDSHLELVRMAADHHVNVICQKPMAPNVDAARAIANLASAQGIRVMIHDNWRWQPWYRQVAAHIGAGDIGQPIGYGFRTRKRDGIGPEPYAAQPYFRVMPRLLIYEVLVHHVDVARFLFGEITSVYAVARRRNPLIVGEDQAILTLRHASGVDGWIDGNRFADDPPDGPVLGDAFFDGEEATLAVAPSGDVLRDGKVIWKNQAAGYRGDSVYAAQAHFVACLRSGASFETDAAGYLHTFIAAESAYTSIEQGRPVSLLPLLRS